MLSSAVQTATNLKKHSSKNPLMQLAINRFHHQVQQMLPDDINSILEVGCGEGFSAKAVLNGKTVLKYGGDVNIHALSQAVQRYPAMRYHVFDATALPFSNQSIDAILSLEVLEHIVHAERAVKEFCRVARKYLLLSVPNEPIFRLQRLATGKGLGMWGDHPEHVNHWSLWGFVRFLRQQGLTPIQVASPIPFAWSIVLCKLD